MDTFDAIYQRRSVKHFDPRHPLTAEEESRLLEAAIQSPTSFNIQNWRFVLVKDAELRREIRAAASDQAQVTEASLVVILAADLLAWQRDPNRYWVNAPDAVREMLVSWIAPFYANDPQLQRDEAMRSCGLAGQSIMLAAKAMGYDSCPMIGFDATRVAELIRLPSDHVISFMIVVGKALQPAWPKPGQLDLADVVVEDRFGS